MLGDDDAVLCVPFEETEKVYLSAKTKRDAEIKTLSDTLAGRLDAKKWVDETLARLGCELIG